MAHKSRVRSVQRVPVQCQVDYRAQACVGRGKVVDLSNKGLRIEGSGTVHTGLEMTITLHLADGQPPMVIPGAFVRWSGGREFGLKLPALSQEMERRLLSCFSLSAEQLALIQ